MNLYEITGEFLELLDKAETEDVSEMIEKINASIEEKADAYAKVISQLTGDVQTIKKEEKRLSDKKATIEANIKRIKENLEKAMIMTEKTKFKTNLFSFSIQNNPPSIKITGDVPEEFTETNPKPNNSKIKEAIKNGEWIDFAELIQTKSLRIR